MEIVTGATAATSVSEWQAETGFDDAVHLGLRTSRTVGRPGMGWCFDLSGLCLLPHHVYSRLSVHSSLSLARPRAALSSSTLPLDDRTVAKRLDSPEHRRTSRRIALHSSASHRRQFASLNPDPHCSIPLKGATRDTTLPTSDALIRHRSLTCRIALRSRVTPSRLTTTTTTPSLTSPSCHRR